MKALTKLLFAVLVAMIGFSSCDRQEEVAPTIEIQGVAATENSIIFTINAKGATKCAYMLYDGEDITPEEIFADGDSVKGDGSNIMVEQLKSGTKYYVAAAAKNSVGVDFATTMMVTLGSNTGDNTGDNGGNNGDNGGNDGGNGGGNNDDFELPEIDGVENVVIEKTKDGRWYEPYNYYVTFVCDNGDRIILDFFTISETMSQYFPYGQYLIDSNCAAYTFHSDSSGYVPAGASADGGGYLFTDGYVSVDVVNGMYAIYMMLTYDANGVEKTIQGYYNGILSGASIPAGDDIGSDKLIEVLEVGSTSFKFRINAAADQYWRCSVVDKRTYDQYQSNPGAWVVSYGFMLNGTLTFNWEDGKECEYVPGLPMSVTSSTDYLIIAALMDYSEGQENSLLGGVEVVQIRTNGESVGSGSVNITMKQINVNDVVFDCVFGDNVWSCYAAMLETANIEEIKAGTYVQFGYTSYEECMLSLVPGLSPEFKRQFMSSQYDYKWENLKYDTSYTLCIKVLDNNGGATFQEYGPFTTNR